MEKKKKFRIWTVVTIVFVGMIAVLLSNRARMTAKARSKIMTSVPVSVVTVQKQKLVDRISVVGTITANNDVTVLSETQGRIVQVFVKVGDYVQAGSPLVQVDDEMKKANFAAAEVNYEKAKKDRERFDALHESGTASATQLESARLAYKSAEAQYVIAKKQLQDTRISSPIAGIVSSRPVNVGAKVSENTLIANVVDIATLKVRANLAERDVFKIKVNDKVDVTTDVYPGVHFAGTIETISAKADENHTYAVEIKLPNSRKNPLKAGMFGRATVESTGQNESLTIPRRALVGSAKNPQVFTVEVGIAVLRQVVLGGEFGDNLQIISGLTGSERVVISGQNNLKDSTSVRIEE